MDTVPYGGWPCCPRLSDGAIELVATADVGPRVIRFGFAGGRNLLKEFPEQLGLSGGGDWRPYGGHRLWHAPEADPRTYAPDNDPVEVGWDGRALRLTPPVEAATGIAKQIEIELHPGRAHATLRHRLVNRSAWPVELAVWALTAMAPGGCALLPQEPIEPRTPERLLPTRRLALWSYTDMADPRFTWGRRLIRIRQQPGASTEQKLGLCNRPGWAAYSLGDELLVKRYPYLAGARYPDLGCNTEIFTDAETLEIESLGPLCLVAPGEAIEHVEDWFLFRIAGADDEDAMVRALEPALAASSFAGPPVPDRSRGNP
jgi:hypothetical protein